MTTQEQKKKWFKELTIDNKDEVVFKLEMMLKSIITFSNPNNRGKLKKKPSSTSFFEEELKVVVNGIEEAKIYCDHILSLSDKTFSFQQYIASSVVHDYERCNMLLDSVKQNDPQKSLYSLYTFLVSLIDLIAPIFSQEYIPPKYIFSLYNLINREFLRNTFFAPKFRLDIITEYDKIENPNLLNIINKIPYQFTKKSSYLIFLILLRNLRYINICLQDFKVNFYLNYLIISLVRSELRSLVLFIKRDLANVVSQDFENLIWETDAKNILAEKNNLIGAFDYLNNVKEITLNIANRLSVDIDTIYTQIVPSLEEEMSHDDKIKNLEHSEKIIIQMLERSIIKLATIFEPDLIEKNIFSDYLSTEENFDKLRTDIWIFSHILNAFIAKLKSHLTKFEFWNNYNAWEFIQDFISYYNIFGYQLIKSINYPQMDVFMNNIYKMKTRNVHLVMDLVCIINGCEDLNKFLINEFNKLSEHELKKISFNKANGAQLLKNYLINKQ